MQLLFHSALISSHSFSIQRIFGQAMDCYGFQCMDVRSEFNVRCLSQSLSILIFWDGELKHEPGTYWLSWTDSAKDTGILCWLSQCCDYRNHQSHLALTQVLRKQTQDPILQQQVLQSCTISTAPEKALSSPLWLPSPLHLSTGL